MISFQVGSTPFDVAAQSTITDNSALISSEQPKSATVSESLSPTPLELISSSNELLYSPYDFESSPSVSSKRSCVISVDNDESFTSTPLGVVS